MKADLVTIVLPCYNAEDYIGKFLNQFLNQDYENIELVIVDDGSSDSSSQIIDDFKDRIPKNSGKHIVYEYQKNSGLPAAINKGLGLANGEFVSWSDPDDFLESDSISTKVSFLKGNSDYEFVRTKVRLIDEEGRELQISNDKGIEKIFNSLVFEKGVPMTPGNYLVRTSSLMKVLPDEGILEGVRGQNWQLLLPLAYHYKCGYIKNIGNNYLVRSGSMSHNDKTVDDEIFRCDEHQEIILKTTSNFMNCKDWDLLKRRVEDKYWSKKFFIACRRKHASVLDYFESIRSKRLRHYLSIALYKFNLYGFALVLKNKLIKYH